jgi:hypothetical protein
VKNETGRLNEIGKELDEKLKQVAAKVHDSQSQMNRMFMSDGMLCGSGCLGCVFRTAGNCRLLARPTEETVNAATDLRRIEEE